MNGQAQAKKHPSPATRSAKIHQSRDKGQKHPRPPAQRMDRRSRYRRKSPRLRPDGFKIECSEEGDGLTQNLDAPQNFPDHMDKSIGVKTVARANDKDGTLKYFLT